MEIQVLNHKTPRWRLRIERFLKQNGLRPDTVDYYAVVVDEDTDEIVAGGGLDGNVMKCIAVAEEHKGEAIANKLVSHLIAHATGEGYSNIKLFTKPQNRPLFESLSFRLIAEAPEAIMMETGIGGIRKTVERLKANVAKTEGLRTGAIVMNCNPFTLGHRYLIEQAAGQVERLYVMVVSEDCSLFSYAERKAMVVDGTKGIENVCVLDGTEYSISRTTFPTYFLKRLDDAADTQMLLDLDLFRRHIAPALGATVRFVGSEPADALTRRYNELMHKTLQEVCEIERLEIDGEAVSASAVRRAMENGDMTTIRRLVPPTTLPYIIAHLATQALQAELDTTPKPGLVDRHDNGAHHDMDYALMHRSIRTLHAYFVRLALLGFADSLPLHADIQRIGIEAEQAMFGATGGVNTHKGALFSIGLAVVAAAYVEHHKATADYRKVAMPRCHDNTDGDDAHSTLTCFANTIKRLAADFPYTKGTHGCKARQMYNVRGALDNARDGYVELFADWLPYYMGRKAHNDPYALHKTLLRIMCSLDDTNIVYRTDLTTANTVKQEALSLLENFSERALEATNREYSKRNISPGGAADMLSLTLFVANFDRNTTETY